MLQAMISVLQMELCDCKGQSRGCLWRGAAWQQGWVLPHQFGVREGMWKTQDHIQFIHIHIRIHSVSSQWIWKESGFGFWLC